MASTNIDFLAGAFIGTLGLHITEEEFKEFLRKTREEPLEGACWSHDYCDANMTMAAAFQLIFGREPDVSDEPDTALINAAWDRALQFIKE